MCVCARQTLRWLTLAPGDYRIFPSFVGSVEIVALSLKTVMSGLTDPYSQGTLTFLDTDVEYGADTQGTEFEYTDFTLPSQVTGRCYTLY